MSRRPWHPARELRLLSQHMYGFARAAAVGGLAAGEESITDLGMVCLRRRRFPFVGFRGRLPDRTEVHIRQFNPREEGVEGADWALVVLGPRTSVAYRIQAKRLYPTGEYTRLKARQIQTLRARSGAIGAHALVAFYNGPQAGPVTSACRLPLGESRLGCTVVPAALCDGPPRGIPPWNQAGIGSRALPLECLVACRCYGSPAPKVATTANSTEPSIKPLALASGTQTALASSKDQLMGSLDASIRAWADGDDDGNISAQASDQFAGISYLLAVDVRRSVQLPDGFYESRSSADK